jgi:hypothetical protein
MHDGFGHVNNRFGPHVRIAAVGDPKNASLIADAPKTKRALDSASERIQSLEDVLVAIRAGIVTIQCHTVGAFTEEVRSRQAALTHIVALINETLDPCKPWCVLEPGHHGACEPHELERD